MKTKPAGQFFLFTDEESKFLLQKHQLYSKQLANEKNDKFRRKKDIWDQISLDIQMKFNRVISAKQCATRLDTIQKRGKRKSAKMAMLAKKNAQNLKGQFLGYLSRDDENSNLSFNDESNDESNSLDYLNESQESENSGAPEQLITARECFYAVNNYPPSDERERIPAESLNPLSIISAVGLSRRPNILSPPVSTASSSSNNEITSTTLPPSAVVVNPDPGEIPFLKKSLVREREIVRTLQLQISHYESYIEILLDRIKDLDTAQSGNVPNINGSGELKQEPS